MYAIFGRCVDMMRCGIGGAIGRGETAARRGEESYNCQRNRRLKVGIVDGWQDIEKEVGEFAHALRDIQQRAQWLGRLL
jgi:hypothetical protein